MNLHLIRQALMPTIILVIATSAPLMGAVNNAPVAVDDVATTSEGMPVAVAVLANDTDADGNPLSLISATEAAYGQTVLSGSSVVYTPKPGFYGADGFSYVVGDGNGGTAVGWVDVDVQKPAGLVLNWRFDEASGTIAWDSAGAHHGGIFGTWARAAGKQGTALGIQSGIVQTGDANDVHLQQMTISLWMKPSATFAAMGTYAGLFDRLDWAGNSGFYLGGISPGTNQIAFMLMNGATQDQRGVVQYQEASSNQWVHLAAVYNGSSMILYRNGAVAASQVVGALAINYDGNWPINAANGYQGGLDDLRVYDRALSVSEVSTLAGVIPPNTPPVVVPGPDRTTYLPSGTPISATVTDDGLPSGSTTVKWLKVSGPGTVQFANSTAASTSATFSASGTYVLRLKASDGDLSAAADVYVTAYAAANLTRGLVGWWKMDHTGNTSVATDSSTTGAHATLYGNTKWKNGYFGKALELAGGNDLGAAPDKAAVRVQQLTVSAWIRSSNTLAGMASLYPLILSKQNWAGNSGFFFGTFTPDSSTLGLRLMTGSDVFSRVEMQTPLADSGVWHHVCGIYDGAYLRIYHDGDEQPGSLRVGPVRINHQGVPLIMGQGFEGLLDDLRLYNRPLSPIEIDTLTATPPSNSG